MSNRSVVIVGLFQNRDTSPVTQASVLAEVLRSHSYNVITVSAHKNKWFRLADIIFTLLLKYSKYDIAIVQFYSGNSFIWQYIAAKIVKLLGKKLVFTVHGGGVPGRLKSKYLKYTSLLNEADLITVPSNFMGNTLNDYDINTHTVENCITVNSYPYFNKRNFKPVILWMRAFSDIYNPLMAVKVAAVLKNKYPQVKMYMGGPDLGLLNETEKTIDALGLHKNVEIVGFMNNEAKISFASICDVYISTNKIDNAPVSILEMWAMGLPVISTNVGGIPYLIDNYENGIIAEDDNPDDMADKLTSIFENSELGMKLVTNAREKVKKFDEHVVFDKWDKLLNAL